MAGQAVRPPSDAGSEPASRWRTVDIVVTATLGVAFGVVFWAWGLLWAAPDAPFTAFPPGQAVIYGVWLVPAVLAPLIVRKPGAALFAELMAAIVSALLGSTWGTLTIVYGLLQGLAGEAGFAAFRYRRFAWPQALLAALLAGAMAAVLDLVHYYPDWTAGWKSVLRAARGGQHDRGRRPRRARAVPRPGRQRRAVAVRHRPHPGLTRPAPPAPVARRAGSAGWPSHASRHAWALRDVDLTRRAGRAGAAHRRLRDRARARCSPRWPGCWPGRR